MKTACSKMGLFNADSLSQVARCIAWRVMSYLKLTVTIECGYKYQLAVDKSYTQKGILLSESTHNLVPDVTATLFMNQFCEDGIVGRRLDNVCRTKHLYPPNY